MVHGFKSGVLRQDAQQRFVVVRTSAANPFTPAPQR